MPLARIATATRALAASRCAGVTVNSPSSWTCGAAAPSTSTASTPMAGFRLNCNTSKGASGGACAATSTPMAKRRPGAMSTCPLMRSMSRRGASRRARCVSAHALRSSCAACACHASAAMPAAPMASRQAATPKRRPRDTASRRCNAPAAVSRKPPARSNAAARAATSSAAGQRGRISEPAKPRLAMPDNAGSKYSGVLKIA